MTGRAMDIDAPCRTPSHYRRRAMPTTDCGDKNNDSVLASVLAAAAEVFGRPVHPEDNFFDLGGDSITAVELVLRLTEELGLVADTADLVDAPDFGAFARDLGASAKHVSERGC